MCSGATAGAAAMSPCGRLLPRRCLSWLVLSVPRDCFNTFSIFTLHLTARRPSNDVAQAPRPPAEAGRAVSISYSHLLTDLGTDPAEIQWNTSVEDLLVWPWPGWQRRDDEMVAGWEADPFAPPANSRAGRAGPGCYWPRSTLGARPASVERLVSGSWSCGGCGTCGDGAALPT